MLLLAACAVRAQIAGTGNIQGAVVDSSGALIPNATVTLTDASTQVKRMTLTDRAGVYVFPNIAIGTYTFSGIFSGNVPAGTGPCGTSACPAGVANLDVLMGAMSTRCRQTAFDEETGPCLPPAPRVGDTGLDLQSSRQVQLHSFMIKPH